MSWWFCDVPDPTEENEVASGFAFILKIRKIHGTSVLKMTVTGRIRTYMCMRAFFLFVVDKSNQHTNDASN